MLRLLQLAAACCLGGPPVFVACVWRPAAAGHNGLARQLERRVRAITVAAAAVLSAGALAELLQAPGGINTGAGRLLAVRVALAGVIAAATAWPPRLTVPVLARALASAGVFATFSLTGHAAARLPDNPGPLLANVVHVGATAVWYGGLLCFLLLPWRDLHGQAWPVLARTVHRFSRIGLLTMGLLAVTGLALADTYVYGPAALIEHPYGLTLLLKLGIVAGVLGMAAINHIWVRPRLRSAVTAPGPEPARRFRVRRGAFRPRAAAWLERLVRGEIAGGLLVLIVAVRLAATAPPAAEPVRLHVTIEHGPADAFVLQVPPRQPVRLTVSNPNGPVAGYYIPQISATGADEGRAGDLQVMVEPGTARTVVFQAPAAGQYVIYYVGREGLRPAGWLLIEPPRAPSPPG